MTKDIDTRLERIRNDLKRLQELANKACNAAIKNRKDIDDPVNWGDLSCSEVGYVITLEGGNYYRILVEEASPHCPNLKVFIMNYITEADVGFDGANVEVITEW